ncbi:MAG: four helix bundle protein [Patescibacteria group bacterium]
MNLLNQPLLERADQLAHATYDLLSFFPPEEKFALVSQIRRAVISIPSNIIEGYARKKSGTFTYHLEVAYGSLMELKYQLYFSCKRSFILPEQYMVVWPFMDEVGKMLWKSIDTMENKKV